LRDIVVTFASLPRSGIERDMRCGIGQQRPRWSNKGRGGGDPDPAIRDELYNKYYELQGN